MTGGPKTSRTWGYWIVTRLLWAVVVAAIAATCYWLLWEGLDEWRDSKRWQDFPLHLRDGCDPHKTLDACQLKQVVYLWLPTAAAALAAIPLLSMGAHLRISRHPVLSRQLPPRCFWASWCGGVSVADAIVVIFWAVVNAAWMGWIMYRYELMAPFFEKRMSHFQVQWVLVSVALGQLLTPNLVLLFYPVTRGSVLLQLTGISYPNAIRYHRWLGHATLVFATAHSLGFWGIWLWQQRFMQEAFEQGARINNLMGGLSFISGLALWLTSLEAARRWSYDLFYKLHHAGFWGFMLLGCMHYSPLFWAFLPGMMLYAVDAIYRLSQVTGRTAQVLDANASEDTRVACLTLVSPTWGVAPTGYVWINAPAISRSEWHPFEYISVEPRSLDQPTGLAIHTKAYSRWTKKLVRLVQQQGSAIQLRVEGPYPELPPQDLVGNKKGIVMVAGGIGITAALSVFKELGHHSDNGKDSGEKPSTITPPVLLVWAARNVSELALLAPKVVQIAEEAGIDMQVHVYFTGDAHELHHYATNTGEQPSGTPQSHFVLEWAAGNHSASIPGKPAASVNGATANGIHVTSTSSVVSGNGHIGFGANGVSTNGCINGPGKVQGPPSRPTPLCPVLPFHSLAQQAAHKLQLHAIVFAGSLAALLVVRAAGSVQAVQEWPTAWLGASYVLGITVCALAPGMVALGLWRMVYARWTAASLTVHKDSTRQERPGGAVNGIAEEQEPLLGCDERAEAESENAAEPQESMIARVVSAPGGTQRESLGESNSLRCQHRWLINLGRPPLEQLLRGFVNRLEQLPGRGEEAEVVQVYGMGPEPLVLATQLLCDDVNRVGGRESNHNHLKVCFERKTFDL